MRREPLLLAALAMLCCGTMVNLGELSTPGIVFLLAGLALALVALRSPDSGATTLEWAGAVVVCALMLPILTSRDSAAETIDAVVLIALSAGVLLVPRRARIPVLACAAASLVALTVLPWRFGHADIDVFTSVQQASAALLHGQNPYSTTFITANQVSPTLFVAQRVHFQYLPGVAILAAPARLLGDVRIMAAIATLTLIAAALWLARQSPQARVRTLRIAVLCCALPVSALMVVNAWVDVYAVAGFAGWLALRRAHPRWGIVALVVCLSIKPTILIALVPLFLWSRAARRDIVIAALAAAAVMVPFAIATGIPSFLHDVAGVQASLGFRYDGLTLSALTYHLVGYVLPLWLTLPAGAAVAVVALARRPRDLSGALVMGAVLSTAAFLLAKWAFFNYYFIPVWLLALALAARGVPLDAPEGVHLPLQHLWARGRPRLFARRWAAPAGAAAD